VPLPHADGDGRDAQAQRVRGSDDFAGLRAYAKGDPVRHIAWRAMARNPEGRTLTKLFDGGASGEVALTLDAALIHSPGLEPAISLLTRWVLDADAQALRYALVLPGLHLRPASGSAHRAACLEALALHRSG
jgi:uncharacterized protein (DUF58 family)